jgi:ESS family glutamate:Na+ symporter
MTLFENFTPWAFFVDLGLISLLLLVGQILRAKVQLIQQLFIPPSLIAGLLGLAFGPNGLGWLPFSNELGTYAAILIAIVFAALPFSSESKPLKEVVRTAGPMWAYAQLGMLLQWGVVGLIGLFVIKAIWPHLHDAFGIMLPTGFYGGHGTAAAIGSAFEGLNWEDARSLGMMTATLGVIMAIAGGLIFVKWATRNKQTAFIADFEELPDELRSGLVPTEKRTSIGSATTSSISIDSLTYHTALVCVSALVGYLCSRGIKSHFPMLELPVFSCAFIVSLLLKRVLDLTKISEYVCPQTTVRIGSMATDLLVAFGVASIKLSVIVKYAAPLIVLVVLGTIVTFLITFFFGRRLSKTYWFERTIFAWGWWTGTMAMGIALLRIVDPKLSSKAMDDYALAYLPIAPLEIALITFAPILFANGMGVWLLVGCLALAAITILIAWFMKWFVPRKRE